MKKRTIVALILAAVLIVSGGIILTLGLSFAGNHTQKSELIRQEITIKESFENVSIDTQDCDVRFAMFSGRDDCMVEIRAYEKTKHSAVVEDGTLKIEMIDERNWTDFIGVFHLFGGTETMGMTVYLPAAEYASLQVRTETGDITVQEEPSFKEMLLRSDTGEISCVGASGDVLDCMTSTGDISVHNSAPALTKLQSNTGDLKVSVVAGDEIHVTTNTGDVDAQNATAPFFTCSTDTGEVELEKVTAEDYLQVFTTTGDAELDSCDAGKVNIKTETGDVSGHFLTPKWFQAHSNTGNVRVPQTREGGECCIQSETGDIHFE